MMPTLREDFQQRRDRGVEMLGRIAHQGIPTAITRGEAGALLAERANLREALEAIVVRCEEGDPRSDWLPTIASIAKEALRVNA